MADDDKIIRFPGPAKRPKEPTPPATPPGPEGLSEDQRKALGIVAEGMTFVCIGIRPTDRGADFFTAVHGDAGELRNALDHLPGVIERAFARKGVVK
jgi:hypothetical protein